MSNFHELAPWAGREDVVLVDGVAHKRILPDIFWGGSGVMLMSTGLLVRPELAQLLSWTPGMRMDVLFAENAMSLIIKPFTLAAVKIDGYPRLEQYTVRPGAKSGNRVPMAERARQLGALLGAPVSMLRISPTTPFCKLIRKAYNNKGSGRKTAPMVKVCENDWSLQVITPIPMDMEWYQEAMAKWKLPRAETPLKRSLNLQAV